MSGAALASAVLAVLLTATTGRAADLEVTASVDANPAVVGESVVLTVHISGAQNVPAPDLAGLKGLQARYLGPSTQVSIVNGAVSATVSHRYSLTATTAGRFTLGPFRVESGGRTYESNVVQLQVAAGPQAGSASAQGAPPGQLRLVVRPAKSAVWVGERIALEIKLYVGDVRVDDLQFPLVAGEGVMVDKLDQPARQAEIVEGRRYQVLRFSTSMTALRPGAIDLGGTMAMSLVVPRRRGRGNLLFDDFLGDAFGERRSVEVRAEPLALTVRALPDAGRPADFSGAVGQFDFELSAKPTEVNVGDPVTVHMRITGNGDLSRVATPRIDEGERFRAYDPLPVKEEDGPNARVFEQVLIPKQAGPSEVPELRFSFFDPESGSYRVVTRGPVPLTVRAREGEEMPRVVVAEEVPEAIELPGAVGRDIVFIKDSPGSLTRRGTPLHASAWFLALQALPPALFAVLLVYARRRERDAADPSLARFRQAGGEARRRLSVLGQAADGEERFYDELSAAIASYLGAKLDLPPGAVDRERVLARLSANGSPAELAQRVQRFFELIEGVRYASGSAGGKRETALDLAKQIVDGVERAGRTSARRAASLILAGVLAVATAGLQLPAQTAGAAAGERLDPHTSFFRGNTAYGEGRHAEAAEAYEQALEAGVESAALYFNLGNADFKSGKLGEAILNYERAKRLAPRDPDVRANLSYAEEEAGTRVEPPSLWQRFAFPLAFRFTAGGLAVAASVLWFALWAVLSTRLLRPRLGVPLGRAVRVVGVLFALTIASIAFRLVNLELRDVGVVTAAGETAVRFEPSETGTEHFPVREGTLLDITEQRQGWLQVRRRDGRRGWIPEAAVSRARLEERS